jgi:hypothetical protein
MEMISKVTRSIYRLIEKIAEKEIEKDPIAFIREQSMLRPSPQGVMGMASSPSGGGGPDESESFAFDEESKEDGQYEDIKVESDDPMNKHSNMYDPELVEELDEVFKSAHDLIMSTMPQSGPKESKKNQRIIIEEEEKGLEIFKTGADFSEYAVTRDRLPFFKDPKIKISLWSIIKDSIGKDISKITVPVYFNAPLSLL